MTVLYTYTDNLALVSIQEPPAPRVDSSRDPSSNGSRACLSSPRSMDPVKCVHVGENPWPRDTLMTKLPPSPSSNHDSEKHASEKGGTLKDTSSDACEREQTLPAKNVHVELEGGFKC